MNDTSYRSRRDFLKNMAVSGIGFAGLGAFIQSCAEKNIPLSADLGKAYIDGVLKIIAKIKDRELLKIRKSATIAVQAKLQGHTVYAHIEGAMFPAEISPGRPGSPHIFVTENIQKSMKDDVLITNNPETARGLGEQYVKIIGITTPSVPNFSTPPGALENMGVLLIEDVADVVIDCHVPYTDGILNVQGIDIPICPASGIIHSMIYYALAAEIVEGYTMRGIYPQIGGNAG